MIAGKAGAFEKLNPNRLEIVPDNPTFGLFGHKMPVRAFCGSFSVRILVSKYEKHMSIRLGDKTYLLIRKKLEEWEKRKGFLCLGLTIQALSKSVGVNRTYLSNFINDTYGKNFNRWVNELRVEEAKSRMESAEYSLAEIATQVGFADLAHFSKQFKLKEGVSPSVWRKKFSVS